MNSNSTAVDSMVILKVVITRTSNPSQELLPSNTLSNATERSLVGVRGSDRLSLDERAHLVLCLSESSTSESSTAESSTAAERDSFADSLEWAEP